MRLITFEKNNPRRQTSKKYPYIVRFNSADPGAKPFFNNFTQLIGDISAKYDLSSNGWLVSQMAMSAFFELDSKLFSAKKPRFRTVKDKMKDLINTEIPTLVQDAESMGSMMKLQPYPYQKEVIKFCLDAKTALIVSPCGSGKTPIMIGLFLEARKAGIINGPGLIVVKTSLKTQWAAEVKKFSDLKAKIIPTSRLITPLYSRSKKERMSQGNFMEGYDTLVKADQIFVDKMQGADLYITNYETLNDENVRRVLNRLGPIDFVGVDEIHYVKNYEAERSKSLQEVSFKAKVRVGATATPVQRDPMDLYGIYKVINPNIFNKVRDFQRKFVKYGGYGRITGAKNEELLNKTIKPYLIIKTKEDVAKHLPRLTVSQVFCDLDPKVLDISDQLMAELDELHEEEKKYLAAAHGDPYEIERIKHTNPELVKLEAAIVMRQTFAQELADSQELLRQSESEAASNYVTRNKPDGKLETFLDILENYWDENPARKICVFSKYKRMQDILVNAINKASRKRHSLANTGVAYVNGSLSPQQRYSEVYEKFQGEKSTARLLLCSDAGAEGLNLRECDVLIEYDLADSYAVQTQRHGRVERADSIYEHANVIQLIANHSWDEIQHKIVSKKRNYDRSIIHGEKPAGMLTN